MTHDRRRSAATIEKLLDAERRFLESSGLRGNLDLTELPTDEGVPESRWDEGALQSSHGDEGTAEFAEDGETETAHWDVWVYAAPFSPPTGPLDDQLHALDAWKREQERRQTLVDYARGLLKWTKSTDRSDRSQSMLKALPAELERERRALKRRVRASEFYRVVQGRSAAARKKSAVLTCRCPEGCNIVNVYVGPVHNPGATPELLLIAQGLRRERDYLWMAGTLDEPITPSHLPIACRHGRGKYPTAYPIALDRTQHKTVRVIDVAGASWAES